MFVQISNAIINTDYIKFIKGRDMYIDGYSDPVTLAPDDLAVITKTLLPKSRVKAVSQTDKRLQELFTKLHHLTGGKGTAVFNGAREAKLKALMTRHNLSEEMLVRAATNIGQDEYLQGKSDKNSKRYGDIDYLLRPDKAAKWAEFEASDAKVGRFL